MDDLIDEVLTMTREGEDVEETGNRRASNVSPSSAGRVSPPVGGAGRRGRLPLPRRRGRLRHVFENLFRNAIEHATRTTTTGRRGGNRQTDDGVSERRPPTDEDTATQPTGFYVADDGPGIPEDEREDVFDHGYTTSEGGTGLGPSRSSGKWSKHTAGRSR